MNQNVLDKYKTSSASCIDNNDFSGKCWSIYRILPELTGSKVNIGTIALVKALGATLVRITTGCITCDSRSGRATIYVDTNDLIKKIEMELLIQIPKEWGNMSGIGFDSKVKGD